MATEAKLKLGEIEKKFIITARYGTTDGSYPSATVALSTIDIRYPKSSDSKHYSKPPIKKIYRNGTNHAEVYFLQYLENTIKELLSNDKEVKNSSMVIEATLVQNYSPCNINRKCLSGCADEILKSKKKIEDKGIKFSLTVKFANFYKHYEKANTEGLAKLWRADVTLKLLRGEKEWQDFLSDTTFVDLTPAEHDSLLKRAKSDDRVNREIEDLEIFEKKISGEAQGK